jgi:RNA polymerase sigma-70 factor (ECF subfamily)
LEGRKVQGGEAESDLIARAATGDAKTVTLLLSKHHDRLTAYIRQRLPASLQASISAEDIVQQTLAQAWKDFGSFNPDGQDSVLRWLKGIARHRLQDGIRANRRAKRGGGIRLVPLHQAGPASSSVADLLNLLAGNEETASRLAMRHEAEEILRQAVDRLPEDRRKVIQLRFLEQLDWSEVAARMERSKRAVMMLCQRALDELLEKLGTPSQYLSRKE